MTDERSYNDIKSHIKGVENEINDIKEKIIFIVGNKIDIDNRRISREDGENIARDFNADYLEISCKTGEGLEVLVNRIIMENIHSNSFKLKLFLKEKPLKKKKNKAECLIC